MVMRQTLDGFQGGLQIGGRMIKNLRYADDIILLATSEAELQRLQEATGNQGLKWRVVRELLHADDRKSYSPDEASKLLTPICHGPRWRCGSACRRGTD